MLFEPSVAPAMAYPSRRSAALLLHGMSEADRAWAWDRLELAQREALGPLLQELKELGVPSDATLVGDVVATAAVVGEAVTETTRQQVAHADATQVAKVLSAEPAGLVRRVLALGPWPWQEAVLAILRVRRGDVFEPLADTTEPAAPALEEALLARLAERLSKVSTGASESLPWWAGLLQAARSRLGGRTR